jgi:hypothetical protein
MPEAAKNSNARECDPALGTWQQINELVRVFALAVLIQFVAPDNSPAESPPFNVVQGDGLLHVASGFLFPAQIGEFRRIVTKQYDQAGRDISVGYNADGPEIAATIFIYPVHGKKPEEEFQFRKNEGTPPVHQWRFALAACFLRMFMVVNILRDYTICSRRLSAITL